MDVKWLDYVGTRLEVLMKQAKDTHSEFNHEAADNLLTYLDGISIGTMDSLDVELTLNGYLTLIWYKGDGNTARLTFSDDEDTVEYYVKVNSRIEGMAYSHKEMNQTLASLWKCVIEDEED